MRDLGLSYGGVDSVLAVVATHTLEYGLTLLINEARK
jgi:hypothetical protein